jgi:hypothetical protein
MNKLQWTEICNCCWRKRNDKDKGGFVVLFRLKCWAGWVGRLSFFLIEFHADVETLKFIESDRSTVGKNVWKMRVQMHIWADARGNFTQRRIPCIFTRLLIAPVALIDELFALMRNNNNKRYDVGGGGNN